MNSRFPKEKRHEMSMGRQWITVLLAVVLLTVLGAALTATAPLDGPERNNLGVGLLTGVITGGALILVEYMLEKSRSSGEAAEVERQRQSLNEYGCIQVARLIGRHAEELEGRFYSFMQAEGDSSTREPGWTDFIGADELRGVWRSVAWVTDVDLTDPAWHQDKKLVESVDVILQLAVQLITRDDNRDVEDHDYGRIAYLTQDVVVRLEDVATNLSQLAAPHLAQSWSEVAANLRVAAETLDLRTILGHRAPRVPDFFPVDASGVHRLRAEHDPDRAFVQSSLAYLIDVLRLRSPVFGSDWLGDPSAANPHRIIDSPGDAALAESRWRNLLRPDTTADGWERRFLPMSWLHEVLLMASERASWSWGVPSQSAARSSGTD